MKLKILLHNGTNQEHSFRLEPACHIQPMGRDASLELILEVKNEEALLELAIENDEIVAYENDGVFVNIYEDGKLLYSDG